MSAPMVWVAMFHNFEEIHVQACSSREAALHWARSRIPQEDWQTLFDQLDPADRVGMDRDKALTPPEVALAAFVGPPSPDMPDEWGADDCYVQLVEQALFAATA